MRLLNMSEYKVLSLECTKHLNGGNGTNPVNDVVERSLGVDLSLLVDRVDVLERVGGAAHVAVDPEHFPLQLQDVFVHLQCTRGTFKCTFKEHSP